MSNGSKVLGTGGLLTNIIVPGNIVSKSYLGANAMLPMGYSLENNTGSSIETSKDRIEFKFLIPKNFVVKSAYITLNAMPTDFIYFNDNYVQVTTRGYVRNMKLYKSSGYASGVIKSDLANYTALSEAGIYYDEISNAFGSNGFTGSNSGYTTKKSIDIKDEITISTENDTYNILKIETGNNTVSAIQAMYEQSGGLQGTLVINGYTNFE